MVQLSASKIKQETVQLSLSKTEQGKDYLLKDYLKSKDKLESCLTSNKSSSPDKSLEEQEKPLGLILREIFWGG